MTPSPRPSNHDHTFASGSATTSVAEGRVFVFVRDGTLSKHEGTEIEKLRVERGGSA